jgi:hypothetical protein
VSSGTVKIGLKVLRSALNQAKRDGLTEVNETERVTLLKIRGTVRREPFSEKQIKQLLAAANDEWKGMPCFMPFTRTRSLPTSPSLKF